MKTFSKPLKFIALTLAVSSVIGFTACTEVEDSTPQTNQSVESVDFSALVTKGENYVIINADADYYSINKTTLSSYMEQLKSDGVIDYTVSDGMLSSLNGVSNAQDWSNCWMLYSNDPDVVNTTYGTYDIDGVTYTSAAVGMDILPIKDGYKYVWIYISF